MKRAALIVGINRYEDDNILDLHGAQEDALQLWSFFTRTARYDHVEKLLGEEADADQIVDAADHLRAKLNAGDLFLFYFAGHGTVTAGRHLLLCPQVKHHLLEDSEHHALAVRTVSNLRHSRRLVNCEPLKAG